MSKAWIEMIHRYLAMAVGVLIVTMLVVAARRVWLARRSTGPSLPARPGVAAALLGLVMLQGAFGAWTVTQKLQPIFVTTHLLLGLALLALLVWHALSLDDRADRSAPGSASAPGLRALAIVAVSVLVVQIALGGWVSANYAVLACNDFPKCQGVWVPAMDFHAGFQPWRALGKSADGNYLSVAALTAIHWVHRSFAGLVVLALGGLARKAHRIAGLTRPATVLAALLVAQLITGLVNVVFAWPLLAAVLHNAGAAALVATLVVINYRLFRTRGAPRASHITTSAKTPSRSFTAG